MQKYIQCHEGWSELASTKFDNSIFHYSFDFWNTIAVSNPLFKKNRAEYILNLLDQTVTLSQINSAFEKVGKEYNRAIEDGLKTIHPVELYKRVLEDLNPVINIEIDILVIKINNIFLKYPPSIKNEFLTYYETVKKSGITFSLTSNTAFIVGSVIHKFLVSIGLDKKFNFLLFSDELEYGKPNESIFQKLLNTARKFNPTISKNEIIHIGDNYSTDFLGAVKFGIKAFHIDNPYVLLYPVYAAHNITCKNNIPISAEEYSKFKFGDNSIAKKYGLQLFDYFVSKHLSWFKEKNDSVIIYSSPYSHIPTSSYYLSKYFFQLLSEFINNKPDLQTKIKWGKINRCNTYTDDYGSLNAEQRYELIKNDTYMFSEKPAENHRLIFIDDISITGTHQRVIENLMKDNNYNNESIFLYHSKLQNSNINPSFENELNYNYVSSIDKLLTIFYSNDFVITTRALKYILKLSDIEFNYFSSSLLDNNRFDLIEIILKSSIKNGYNNINIFKKNYSAINALSRN